MTHQPVVNPSWDVQRSSTGRARIERRVRSFLIIDRVTRLRSDVAIRPGLTALTRMPRPISSPESVRASDMSPALVAA
jgi:hypothetical protein